MMSEVKRRIAPFVALLDAKYLPLLFAVAPQAYSVYLWLYPKPYDSYGELFAVMGALGFEWVYVGAIAWADEGKSSFWTWATAVVALGFSVLVAYYVHQSEHEWAWLHAGFPLVAFTYTINMYMAQNRKTVTDHATKDVTATEDATEQAQPSETAPSKLAGVDVRSALARNQGNKSATAKELQVSRAAIDKWLERNEVTA